MYRIRFHGRGGQGIKTASRILGTAFFLSGNEVQDAPRYGAERRGAPIFAYVRADRNPIHERGIIAMPDLVLVADETLVGVPTAGVMDGVGPNTVLLIMGDENAETWQERLNTEARIVTLPPFTGEYALIGTACAGAAAGLAGVIDAGKLEQAVREELVAMGNRVISENIKCALESFEAVADMAGIVSEQPQHKPAASAGWVDLALESADTATPTIHAAANSVQVRTGLWRTMRPVLERDHCNKCTWICGSFCPDGVISSDDDGYPAVDYDHCKGCLVCVVQCPHHAMVAIPETKAREQEQGDAA